jgi:hypothetical protein
LSGSIKSRSGNLHWTRYRQKPALAFDGLCEELEQVLIREMVGYVGQ